MANPPVRPWFRLTSIRPVPTPAPTPAPAPAPAPEPRPTLSLPTYRTSSAPSSPQPKPQDKQQQQQQQQRTDTPSSPPRKTPYVQAQPSHPQPQDKTTTQQQRPNTPSSPARRAIPSSSSSSSLPSSPIQKTSQSHSHPPPTSSPDKTIKQPIPVPVRSPMHSPNSKSSITTTAPPPSPLTLPPSHFKPQQEPKIPIEAEHKAVLVQKTVVDKPNPHHNNSSSAELHRETRNAHHGKHHVAAAKERDTKEKKVLDSDDSGNMRVITIAGENRGAYMELIHSPKKHDPKYLHKKGNTKDCESEGSGAEDGKKNSKDKKQKGRRTSSFPMAAYMNSNVQCVNNSLLYHASCSHHDPGLHLSLKKKPSAEGHRNT